MAAMRTSFLVEMPMAVSTPAAVYVVRLAAIPGDG